MITELADQNGDGIMTLEELAEYLHVSMAAMWTSWPAAACCRRRAAA